MNLRAIDNIYGMIGVTKIKIVFFGKYKFIIS